MRTTSGRRATLRHRLGVDVAACVVAVLLTGVVGVLSVLSALDTSATVARLATAASLHQDVDMAHDAVDAIVARSALAGQRNDLTTLNAMRNDLDIQRVVVNGSLGRVIDAVADEPDLLGPEQAAAGDLGEFLTLAERIVDAPGGTAYTGKDWDRFRSSSDALASTLGTVTQRFREALDRAEDDQAASHRRAVAVMVATSLAGIGIITVSSGLLRRSITRVLGRMSDVAAAVGNGDLSRRNEDPTDDELGVLARRFDDVAASLDAMVQRLTADAARSGFSHDLASVLDTIDAEDDLPGVAERAMRHAADSKVELLLADSSRAHLQRVAVHPMHGAPGCGVVSPFDCAAVRRADTVVFRSSEALDACPKLAGRCVGAETAVCAPVGFMGRAVGVLHASRPEGEAFTPDEVERLGTLATALGTRVGTIRAFRTSELRASTDGLTGLLNRRSLEERLNELVSEPRAFSLAVADLDHFKQLNDTYGHETGDRALRLFAEILRSSLRAVDLVARWGGEEFTIAFPGVSAAEAAAACDRVREALFVACSSGTVPLFTVSFGVVDASLVGGVREALRLADEALYAAKSAGRNRVVTGPVAVPAGVA